MKPVLEPATTCRSADEAGLTPEAMTDRDREHAEICDAADALAEAIRRKDGPSLNHAYRALRLARRLYKLVDGEGEQP